MKSVLLTMVLVYLMFCLLLYFMQRNFMYFPTPANSMVTAKKVGFSNEGLTLNGWIVNPNQPKALLYYGGNAEAVELNIPFFEKVLPDFSVYLIPYRGYGESEGSPTEQGLYSDALAIYDQLASKHASISLMGRSLGSAVASHLAARRDIAKLILVTPFDSIEHIAQSVYWMFPAKLMVKDKYNAIANVEQINTPPLIIIGENDQVIPRQHSEQLAAAFADKQTVIISGAGHNDISFFAEFADAISAYLNDN